jgi:hypothetical protein
MFLSLIARVQALVAAGTLKENQAAGLIAKLEQIRLKLENGQTRAANNQFVAFINQVKALVRARRAQRVKVFLVDLPTK